MNRYTWLASLAWVGFILAGSAAQADIVDWDCQDDGDGAIVMTNQTLVDNGGYYELTADCEQYDYPGHVEGWFDTDTETDPIVWIIETVDNATDFDWTDYHIDIGMDKDFQITGVIAPPDWTWTITPPVAGQPLPSHTNPGTGWVGSVDYYAGTPIEIGQSGNFGLIVSFEGSVAFCTEQVPTPEPATLALLAFGGLLVRRRR